MRHQNRFPDFRSVFPLLGIALAVSCAPVAAQVKIQSINDEGVTAPCVGIGVGLLIEKKCVSMVEKEGFVRETEVGYSGLTLGTSGDQDGLITQVEAGSPAEKAGLKAGSAVVAVDGRPAKRTPGSIVKEQIFGPKEQVLHMRLRRGGTERDVEIKRVFWKAPDAPKSPGMMVRVRPLMNWRGQWLPCLSAVGPGEVGVFAYCDSHYGKLGYIRSSELGTTGLTIDTDRIDAAVIKGVEPNSPAAAAGIESGDEIVSVEGKPLAASIGAWANVLLFGRIGTKHSMTVHDSTGDRTVDIVLTARPSAHDSKAGE